MTRRRIRSYSKLTTMIHPLLILSLLLLIATAFAYEQQQYVSNIISNFQSIGCDPSITTLRMSRNFYDGSTSNFYCPSVDSDSDDSGDVPKFIITSNGKSIVTKIRIYASSSSLSIGSAAKGDYDPTSFTLEGLIPNTNIYQPIITKEFNDDWVDRIPQRNIPNIQINSSYEAGDNNLIYTEVTFDNVELYSSYRLMFPSTRVYPNSDSSESYAVEVGGVELVGQLVPENANGEPTQVRFVHMIYALFFSKTIDFL